MYQKELSSLTDEELLEKAKKMKSSAITHAVLIGFMIGIIIYSIVNNAYGLFTLIPIYLIYKFVGNNDEHKALKEVLKERGLQ